jgi:cutinase
MTVGPKVCSQLKKRLGADKVACQGVGGAYKAAVVRLIKGVSLHTDER